jgi:hypothetical protein
MKRKLKTKPLKEDKWLDEANEESYQMLETERVKNALKAQRAVDEGNFAYGPGSRFSNSKPATIR